MARSSRRIGGRFVALVRADLPGVRAGFIALLISSVGSLVTGVTLGSITGTLEALPGLIVLIPAAIGMRGNVFGALGSRLGTQIHAGTFRWSNRVDTEAGQNAAAAMASSVVVAAVLAVLAEVVSVAFGHGPTISVLDFMVVSVVAACLSAVVVLAITVAVAVFCARRDLDLDNVSAPIVTAAGDMVTLPSLFLATYLLGVPVLTPLLAVASIALAVAVFVAALRARGLPILRRVVLESLPILVAAGLVDLVAGMTIERRLDAFITYPALLVLVPGFLEDSGALGSILSARISTRLHLGTLGDGRPRLRNAVEDVMLVGAYALPVFTSLGLSATLAAHLLGRPSPGWAAMLGVALLAGVLATTAAVLVGFHAAVATYRFGLDPDNHGIPIVSSSLDLLGVLSLILAIVALGLT